ncbi:hypothetical protein GCM10022211_05070 [Sphingomonas humi]|uniref:Uncharacterized protein n=1 Tax=Sphingomonas humi TaxID=335630 RepID=A0ABP7RJ58_9SPHN
MGALLSRAKLRKGEVVDTALRRNEPREAQPVRAGTIHMTDIATMISTSEIANIHRTTPSWRAPVTCSAL